MRNTTVGRKNVRNIIKKSLDLKKLSVMEQARINMNKEFASKGKNNTISQQI
jgi:hypothetical protein